MNVTKLDISDLVVFEPRVFADDRGAFFESFNSRVFEDATGLKRDFVQDNHSTSAKNVLRGLHYQLPPFAQGKLVRVIRGAALDVAVDIRRSSPTFGQWASVLLSAQNRKQLWIPEGFAHGFVAREPDTEFLYKATNFYSSQHERCIVWNDAELAIDWSLTGTPLLSPKDEEGVSLKQADLFD